MFLFLGGMVYRERSLWPMSGKCKWPSMIVVSDGRWFCCLVACCLDICLDWLMRPLFCDAKTKQQDRGFGTGQ
jgi:hypothetical protein